MKRAEGDLEQHYQRANFNGGEVLISTVEMIEGEHVASGKSIDVRHMLLKYHRDSTSPNMLKR